jgi:hypothetical protein
MDSRLKMSGMTERLHAKFLRCLESRAHLNVFLLIFSGGAFGAMLLVAVDHVAGGNSQGSLGGAIGEWGEV